jgi:hypothetical protein
VDWDKSGLTIEHPESSGWLLTKNLTKRLQWPLP